MNSKIKQEVLTHLESLINERIIDVFGAYTNDKWRNFTSNLVKKDPTTLASEIAEAVSKGITDALTNDEKWPNGCSISTRLNEIILLPEQVARIINCCWYMNAAQFTQLICERMWFPGWTYDWVLNQLGRTGARVQDSKIFNGMSVAEGLDFVLIRRDGSGVTVCNDGREVVTNALAVEEQCPVTATRVGKPKEMYGAYMSAEELEERIAAKAKAKAKAKKKNNE